MRVMVNGLLSAWGDWAVRGEDGGVVRLSLCKRYGAMPGVTVAVRGVE